MEFIDDHPVVDYRVRFQNRTAITETCAADIKDGKIVVWLERAECQPPSYHAVAKDAEERYRFNIQDVQAAVPLTGQQREAALTYLDTGADQGYLVFHAPQYSEAGLYDPVASQATERQLADVRAVLDAHGYAVAEGEQLAGCLNRVIAGIPNAPEPEPEPEPDPEPEPEPLPEPVGWGPPANGVQVVDQIYRNGKSDDRRLIEEAFG